MPALIFLSLSLMLLSGPTEAVSRRRRQQPEIISSPVGTETSPPSKEYDITVNMSDHENYDGFSNSHSIPLTNVSMQLLGMNSLNAGASDGPCGVNLCDLYDLCNSDEVCITSSPPECQSRCWRNGSEVTEGTTITAGVPPGDTTTLRPLDARTCVNFPGLICIHGIASGCSDDTFSCQCDAGWTGFLCNEACTLPCVHGDCAVIEDGHMFCSCEYTHRGALCDELLLETLGSIKYEELIPVPQERRRIMVAIFSSALAVAVILLIVIPIIMWRLRVIPILKFINMFKHYEDEDGKEFDAFVSMTSTANTEKFVYGCLQPILENHNFKLCLQARDGPAGEAMSETILSALEKSRRIIMIITPDYIANEWNRFEYLIAQHKPLKLRQRIIPIILEDVDKESVNMDKSLENILNSINCLKYPKAKLQSITLNSEEISENIQSPDRNTSVNSSTAFYKSGRSGSTDSVTKEAHKFERNAAKFWKRLVLSMPKKKSQQNISRSILPTLRHEAKYEINLINCEEKSRYMRSNNQTSSEYNVKINCIDGIDNDAFCTNSDNPCKAKDTTEARNKEIEYQIDILTSHII